MLSRNGSKRSDRGAICLRHVQRQELDPFISQSIDKRSTSVNGAESRYHEYCIKTLGAPDGRLEMWPSPLMRYFIFDEFAYQRISGF
jgi:hypothetical protein